MTQFKELGIKPKTNPFVGDKISVKKLFNQPIKVLAHKIKPSKQREGTEYLTLQIEKSGDKRIVFTGSSVLIDQIKRVPENAFPFETVIKGENEHFEFT